MTTAKLPDEVLVNRELIESCIQQLYMASNGKENIYAACAEELQRALTAPPREVEVDPKDLQVSIWPEPSKTGLRVGMSSGVMILHKPTGLVVCYDRERSQHRNRQRALAALTAALSQPKEENDGR